MSEKLETYEELLNWLKNYYEHIYIDWAEYRTYMKPYMEGEEE